MIRNTYWIWHDTIPEEICDFVVKTCNWELSEKGTFFDTETSTWSSDPMLRDSDVIWAPQLSVIGCIASAYIEAANSAAGWNYVYDWMEQIQLGRYTDGGHYGWHQDTFPPDEKDNHQRKLSFTALLNDPNEFEGGEFKFKTLEDFQQPNMKKGSIMVFPSFLDHTVTAVTSGERFSAVTWVNGPAFC